MVGLSIEFEVVAEKVRWKIFRAAERCYDGGGRF